MVSPGDVGPATEADTDPLRDVLRRIVLPERPLSAPMLVMNGLSDQTVLPSWIAAAVHRSCDLGGVITHIEVPDVGHNDIASRDDVPQWIRDRFAALSDCPRPS